MLRLLSGSLIALLLGAGTLFSQSNFCSSSIESTDCDLPPKVSCVGAVLSCEVEKRYSLSVVPWLGSDQFSYLSVGAENCDPTYFFDIKKASDEYKSTLNGERAYWNYEDEIAFFLSSTNNNIRTLAFFDGDGEEQSTHLFSKEDFFWNAGSSFVAPNKWTRIPSEIRWHPTENAIMYPVQLIDSTAGNAAIGGALVKQAINPSTYALGTAVPLFTFTGYTISSNANNFKIAGGDGNDVNGGRFLLSLQDVDSATADERFVVYDFAKDSLVQPMIGTAPFSYGEIFYGEADLASAKFELPTHQFDYATVSASGLFVIGRYTLPEGGTSDTTEGVRIFDLAGNPILRNLTSTVLTNLLLHNEDGHLDVGFFRSGDTIRECIVAKVSQGIINFAGDTLINEYVDISSIELGDILAISWEIDTSGGTLRHNAYADRILEWDEFGANAGFSGDQYSITSSIQTPQESIFEPFTGLSSYPFRALLATKPVENNPSSTPWKRYYGEIIELSLDASDPVPRRILHHRITDTSSVAYQPEAFFSRKGDKFFFHSHHGYDTVGGVELQQDLYFVDLPLRTCKSVRDGVANPSRQAAPSEIQSAYHLFPSPLNSGGKLWLEVEPDSPEVPQATLRLTSLDGRVIQVWSGPVESGSRIQAVLPNLAAGIYVAELVHAESGAQLMQQKVLVR
jgi:hypothetical protein